MNDMTAATLTGADHHAQALARVLPADGLQGTLVGRVWAHGAIPGPAVVALRPEGVFDLSESYPTMSTLLDTAQPAQAVHDTPGRRLCGVDELVQNSLPALAVGPWRPAGGEGRGRHLCGQPDRTRDRRAGTRRCRPRAGAAQPGAGADRREPGRHPARVARSHGPEGLAAGKGAVVPVPGGGHWPRCRGVHQGARARLGRLW